MRHDADGRPDALQFVVLLDVGLDVPFDLISFDGGVGKGQECTFRVSFLQGLLDGLAAPVGSLEQALCLVGSHHGLGRGHGNAEARPLLVGKGDDLDTFR